MIFFGTALFIVAVGGVILWQYRVNDSKQDAARAGILSHERQYEKALAILDEAAGLEKPEIEIKELLEKSWAEARAKDGLLLTPKEVYQSRLDGLRDSYVSRPEDMFVEFSVAILVLMYPVRLIILAIIWAIKTLKS